MCFAKVFMYHPLSTFIICIFRPFFVQLCQTLLFMASISSVGFPQLSFHPWISTWTGSNIVLPKNYHEINPQSSSARATSQLFQIPKACWFHASLTWHNYDILSNVPWNCRWTPSCQRNERNHLPASIHYQVGWIESICFCNFSWCCWACCVFHHESAFHGISSKHQPLWIPNEKI